MVFLAVFYVLARNSASNEIALDRVVTVTIWSIALIITGALAWMLIYLVVKGAHDLTPGFFVHDMKGVGPLNPGGGVKAAIIGSAEQVGIATVLVVPLAILTAIYLNEIKGRLAWPVRFIVDALVGLPSIVAGLIVYSIWVVHHRFSGVAGSAALTVLMLPYVTRVSEEVLRTVPDSLREASLALGAPRWRVIMQVVVPTARAGLLTAVILGVAFGVGETAPVQLTAGGSDYTNLNPLHGQQADLPLFVFNLIFQPNKVDNQRAFSALLVLVILVLVLFVAARFVSNRGQKKLRGGR
ncbi:MAG TPA: phosphate ABC transporter permease PstA [Acidimicrobiales bacterium]|nr:phosphate ABC transporter permease PstA [Acidimicrobiales bacterium]